MESMPPKTLPPALRKHLMELETLARFGCGATADNLEIPTSGTSGQLAVG